MNILVFGSLNIDYVYQVTHFVRPGETLSSLSYKVFAGGKGANQAAALARAGANVHMAGKIGRDGAWLLEKLRGLGVKTGGVMTGESPTGHAIIQVNEKGENAIVLFPGCNQMIGEKEIDGALGRFGENDVVLLQNEINHVPLIIRKARARKMKVCLNPAPFDRKILEYPLALVDSLILNETEGAGITGKVRDEDILATLPSLLPGCECILTLGAKGSRYVFRDQRISMPASQTRVKDTTAAGDTFIGYYLAGLAEGLAVRDRLALASKAAAVVVSRAGAMDSIPARNEVFVLNQEVKA